MPQVHSLEPKYLAMSVTAPCDTGLPVIHAPASGKTRLRSRFGNACSCFGTSIDSRRDTALKMLATWFPS